MLVRDVMNPDPVTISAGRSLRETIRLMLVEDEEYVIVVDNDGNPGGVIAGTDILHAIYQADPPPEEIRVVAVAHAPDFTIDPTLTVRKAVRELTTREQTVAPVMDGLDLVGVVSLSRIMSHPSITTHEKGIEDRGKDQWVEQVGDETDD